MTMWVLFLENNSLWVLCFSTDIKTLLPARLHSSAIAMVASSLKSRPHTSLMLAGGTHVNSQSVVRRFSRFASSPFSWSLSIVWYLWRIPLKYSWYFCLVFFGAQFYICSKLTIKRWAFKRVSCGPSDRSNNVLPNGHAPSTLHRAKCDTQLPRQSVPKTRSWYLSISNCLICSLTVASTSRNLSLNMRSTR